MINVPFLKYEEIAELAESFLAEYGDGMLPIDIEWIVEDRLGIDIIPTPSLRLMLDCEGFITSDGSSIYVDEEVQRRYYARYRFTLAHEVGHWYIHGEQLAQCRFRSIDEWKCFYLDLERGTHGKLEYQANCFAGLVLVPPKDLSRELDSRLSEIASMVDAAKSAGISRNGYVDFVTSQVAAAICRQFEVSSTVVEKRLDFDGLTSRI